MQELYSNDPHKYDHHDAAIMHSISYDTLTDCLEFKPVFLKRSCSW